MDQVYLSEDVKEIQMDLRSPRTIRIKWRKSNGQERLYKLRVTPSEGIQVS